MVCTVLAVATLGCILAGCQPAAPVYEQPRVQEEAASRNSPVVGLKALDFSLADQNDKQVTLASLRGQWIVLYFYPQDDTPGCTCEATEFTKVLESFQQMKARIYGISPDSPSSHKAFIAGYKLGINLLSDPDHKVMSQYGAWMDSSIGDKKYGRVVRSTVIVDGQGVIRYHWPEVIPKGHADRVRQKLAQLQAQAK